MQVTVTNAGKQPLSISFLIHLVFRRPTSVLKCQDWVWMPILELWDRLLITNKNMRLIQIFCKKNIHGSGGRNTVYVRLVRNIWHNQSVQGSCYGARGAGWGQGLSSFQRLCLSHRLLTPQRLLRPSPLQWPVAARASSLLQLLHPGYFFQFQILNCTYFVQVFTSI